MVIRNVWNAEMFGAAHEVESRRPERGVRETSEFQSDALAGSGVPFRPKLCVTPSTGSPINH